MFGLRKEYLGATVAVVSLLFALYFTQIALTVIKEFYDLRQIQLEFIPESKEVLHKYDSIRRFGKSRGDLKPASNSYLDDLMIPDDRDSTIHERENATILMLCRNWEIEGVLRSMRSLEDRFNRRYKYTWTFLNDVPFDDHFIEATTAMASGDTQYGLIPADDWNRPDWIDETLFEKRLQMLTERKVIYGESKSYRNMCRFNSGFFFRQKLLDQYDYYFRVEPDVEYFCDFPYDPFKVLREKKKKYGFVLSIYEYEDTVTTLWDAVEEFMETYPEILHPNNSLSFLTDSSLVGRFFPVVESNTDYNLCHFWSNFEVGDLNFFRSEEYLQFFNHLDSKGGFYYERWGDAPVHSIGASLLLDKNEIHHFDEIGYSHVPFNTCPTSVSARLLYRCICDPTDETNIPIHPNSCLMRWWKNGAGKLFIR
ncbi:unnamed protein product [Kluyveromyces dobzhanskii CBS 2104]|uniref:WGS project CCBQ000000000 data, contig 00058 n=1 Tax=Kluyveromyces dobzhanskii CBS 2104 TaxID=1427455 RepID=A0A0A8LB73_9SACH|nr:unnamed protein product [Kluyveromyces dobzhanskii CBS 2104]